MGTLSKLIGADPDHVYKTCVDIYLKAKRKRPGKIERDYLKLVLLTKPPFDYQDDDAINLLLDENRTIEDLANYIANWDPPYNQQRQQEIWEAREKNFQHVPEIKRRNEDFFREFYRTKEEVNQESLNFDANACLDKICEEVLKKKSPKMQQKIVLICIAITLGFMLLFPPFHYMFGKNDINLGYSFILSPPVYSSNMSEYVGKVDVSVLLAQCVVVILIGCVLWLALRPNKE